MSLKTPFVRTVFGVYEPNLATKIIENRYSNSKTPVDNPNAYVLIICGNKALDKAERSALEEKYKRAGLDATKTTAADKEFAKNYAGRAVALCQLQTPTQQQLDNHEWTNFPVVTKHHFLITNVIKLDPCPKVKGTRNICSLRDKAGLAAVKKMLATIREEAAIAEDARLVAQTNVHEDGAGSDEDSDDSLQLPQSEDNLSILDHKSEECGPGN
jgi:hypothetical protein